MDQFAPSTRVAAVGINVEQVTVVGESFIVKEVEDILERDLFLISKEPVSAIIAVPCIVDVDSMPSISARHGSCNDLSELLQDQFSVYDGVTVCEQHT